ncbi:unnamed protein product [Lactuca virosa]|uniref:Uncharacterized protein n=1 Tax=Lactuca virosa TaxID=75947 RepID=A0AAU9LDN7_9ASTR|nr:unnamed protein product [Lactuca virosa]
MIQLLISRVKTLTTLHQTPHNCIIRWPRYPSEILILFHLRRMSPTPPKLRSFRSIGFRSASSGVLTKFWNRLLQIGGHRQETTPTFAFSVEFCFAGSIGLLDSKTSITKLIRIISQ